MIVVSWWFVVVVVVVVVIVVMMKFVSDSTSNFEMPPGANSKKIEKEDT
jgi:hypothetical protein